MARIVREREATVRRWRKRYLAEGMEGLHDAPRLDALRPMDRGGHGRTVGGLGAADRGA